MLVKSDVGDEGKNRLRQALVDPSWRVRFAAARALVYIHDEAFAPLVPLLVDEIESVRWAAASTIAARQPWDITEERRQLDPEVVLALLGALHDPAPTVRAAAIRGFEPGDGEEAYAALEAGLRDPDYRVRIWPSHVLRDQRAVLALIQVLDDPYLWVRVNAARNLGRLGDRRAVNPLIAQLRTRNRYMRGEAARALGALGDPQALGPMNALRDRSTSSWLREYISGALAELEGTT
jgi:HEAT repeat protein